MAYTGTWTKVGSDWSTWWIISGGSSPSTSFGDIRPYFRTYYDQDLVNNKTKIRINKYAQGYNLNQLTGEGVGALIARSVINGTSQSGSTTLPKTSGYTLTFIEYDYKEITHNADGTCNTVTYSGNGYCDGDGGPSSTEYTANKTFKPPTIPRKFSIAMSNFTINESISPITSAITIGVTSTSFTCNLDYIFYKITSDATYQADKEYYSKSGTTFTLLIAGTNYTVGNAVVGTIYDTIAGNIVDGITQSSYVWTLSSELLTSIYNGSPNSATVYGKITCETFNGETSLGSNVVNFNVIMTDTPSIASVSYETTDALSIGYDVTKQTVIKDISNISITLTPTFPTGASLYRYTVVCGDYSGYFTELPITFSAVQDDAVVITATDTRGAFYSYELALTPFINYSTPAFINAETTVVRNGQLSGEVNLTTNGTWFYGDFATGSPNDIAVYFKYWKTSDAEPSDASYIEIPSGDITKNIDGTWEISSLTLEDATATVIDTIDYNYSWYFKLKVVDETTSKHEITKTVTVGVPVMTEHKDYVDFKNATIGKKQIATTQNIVTGGGYLDNGNFDVWQRKTTGFVNNAITADRWIYRLLGASTNSATQSTNVPTSISRYSLEDTETFDGTKIGCLLTQTIMSDEAWILCGNVCSFSGYIYLSSATGFSLNVIATPALGANPNEYNSANMLVASHINILEDVQTLEDGWNKIECSFTMPTVNVNDVSLITQGFVFGVHLIYSGGSSSRRVNFSQFKLEIGSSTTQFTPKKPAEELELCQRFFQTGYLADQLACGDGTAQMSFPIYLNHLMAVAKPKLLALNTMYAHRLSTAGTVTISASSPTDLTDNIYDNHAPSLALYGADKCYVLRMWFGALSGVADDTYSINQSSSSGNTCSDGLGYTLDAEPWTKMIAP